MTPVKLEGIITGDFGGELKRWSQADRKKRTD
jgi:hypothetical protein